MNFIRNESFLVAVLDSGAILQTNECTDELFNKITNCTTDDEVIVLLNPVDEDTKKEYNENTKIFNKIKDSSILTERNSSIYWDEVSSLSVPKELVTKVLEAEEANNEDAIKAYKNFWTLLSLNPDAQCRENLFWFLQKWGFTISKSGLFVAYRNVDVLYEDEYNTLYTDVHTHTFRIRIGEMVTMPRNQVDSDHNVSCSRGLIV